VGFGRRQALKKDIGNRDVMIIGLQPSGVSPSIGTVRDSANQPYFSPALVNNGNGSFSLPVDRELADMAKPFLGCRPNPFGDHIRWRASSRSKTISLAHYDFTVATYRQTVLTAFQQVEIIWLRSGSWIKR
jgi:hypothetical protein